MNLCTRPEDVETGKESSGEAAVLELGLNHDGRTLSGVPEEALAAVKGACSAAEAFERLDRWARSETSLTAEASDVEDALRLGGDELLRLLLEESFAERGTGDVGSAVLVSGADGSEHRQGDRRHHSWIYKSQFGPVTVKRLAYGGPGRASIHPLDEELNLPKRHHHGFPLHKRAAKLAARGPFDEAVEQIEETTAAKVPKRQLEEIVEEAAGDFEAFYQERTSNLPPPEETGSILSVGIDCKGVPRRKTAKEKEQPPPQAPRQGPEASEQEDGDRSLGAHHRRSSSDPRRGDGGLDGSRGSRCGWTQAAPRVSPALGQRAQVQGRGNQGGG